MELFRDEIGHSIAWRSSEKQNTGQLMYWKSIMDSIVLPLAVEKTAIVLPQGIDIFAKHPHLWTSKDVPVLVSSLLASAFQRRYIHHGMYNKRLSPEKKPVFLFSFSDSMKLFFLVSRTSPFFESQKKKGKPPLCCSKEVKKKRIEQKKVIRHSGCATCNLASSACTMEIEVETPINQVQVYKYNAKSTVKIEDTFLLFCVEAFTITEVVRESLQDFIVMLETH